MILPSSIYQTFMKTTQKSRGPRQVVRCLHDGNRLDQQPIMGFKVVKVQLPLIVQRCGRLELPPTTNSRI